MISAEEARKYYVSDAELELDKIDRAIRKIMSYETSLTLSTGLTREAKMSQDEIYPNFKGGLDPLTIEKLQKLGYVVAWGSHFQSSWVTISWE